VTCDCLHCHFCAGGRDYCAFSLCVFVVPGCKITGPVTMPKRICPFDYDFVPQSKLHISEKELYDEESVKSVYGKTCYFYILIDIGRSL